MVHDAVQALGARPRRTLRAAAALVCCVPLLAGCGGSSSSGSKRQVDYSMVPGVGSSIRSANCTDWEKGTIDQRHSTVIKLRQFAE